MLSSSHFSPQAVAAMPEIEAKNTIVHGSNADSGVFTLDSGRVKSGNQQSGHTYSRYPSSVCIESFAVPAKKQLPRRGPLANMT